MVLLDARILTGAKVSDTIRKGIVSVQLYDNEPDVLALGQLSSLVGSAVFLIAATALGMPVRKFSHHFELKALSKI